ncbi:MAG TPA: hypothetical protein VMV77_02945 [Bacteroidales bacterium]|nr:hypothetical protein [Bacteroidales bacterium]
MKLIEDTGWIAIVEIDGTAWHMASEEYRAMKNKPFHMWPHNLKRINPQPHSCARCIHKPIDFCHDDRRTNTTSPWTWKKGISTKEMIEAHVTDLRTGNSEATDKLRTKRVCRCGMWSRASVFYDASDCTEGEWP